MPNDPNTTAFYAVRYDRLGPIRAMATADGYLMVRRPACAPFVLSAKEWSRLYPEPNPDGPTLASIRRQQREGVQNV